MTDQTAPYPWGPLLAAVAVVVIWGVSFAVTRATVAEIPPMTIAFLRFTLASAVLTPFMRRRYPGLKVINKDRSAVLGLGLCGITLYYAFENAGLKFTTASHATLIISTIPLLTLLTESALHRRFPGLSGIVGSVAAFIGVYLLLGRGGDDGSSLLGDLLVLAASFSWIGYTYLVKHLSGRYPNLFMTAKLMQIGALTFFPMMVLELIWTPFQWPSIASLGGVVFLGLFCSVLAYQWWNWSLPFLGVTAHTNLLYGIPPIGVATGILFLGEPLAPNLIWGGVFILGGVIVANRTTSTNVRNTDILTAEG